MEEIWLNTQETLLSAPNGWSMEFFYDEDLSYGGVQMLFRFYEDQTVDIACENKTAGYFATSYYSYDQDGSATINFDTYNEVLHYFSEPLSDNVSYGGDFEFVIYAVTDDQITLKGKRTGLTYIMTPLPYDLFDVELNSSYYSDSDSDGYYSWTELMEGYAASVTAMSALTDYTFYVDGLQFDTTIESSGLRSTNRRLLYTDPFDETQTEVAFPFIYTFTGIKFYSELTFEGLSFQSMWWSGKMFIDDESGATLK